MQTDPISDVTQAIEARDGHEISRQDAIIDRLVGSQWAVDAGFKGLQLQSPKH
jgi:hypothetical protein